MASDRLTEDLFALTKAELRERDIEHRGELAVLRGRVRDLEAALREAVAALESGNWPPGHPDRPATFHDYLANKRKAVKDARAVLAGETAGEAEQGSPTGSVSEHDASTGLLHEAFCATFTGGISCNCGAVVNAVKATPGGSA